MIAFERATNQLATGSRPERSTCIHLREAVLPRISKSPTDLIVLAQRIPDKTLASAFNTVLSLKLLVVLGCATGAPSTGAQDPKGYTSIRDFDNGLQALLLRHGIKI